MLDIVQEVVAPWPVRLNVVSPDGQVEEEVVTLHFARIGATRYNELFVDVPLDSIEVLVEHAIGAFIAVVRGWEGVLAGGKVLPFNTDNAMRLMDFPGFAGAFGHAYRKFFFAEIEEREKNSDSSLAGGPVIGAPGAATRKKR